MPKRRCAAPCHHAVLGDLTLPFVFTQELIVLTDEQYEEIGKLVLVEVRVVEEEKCDICHRIVRVPSGHDKLIVCQFWINFDFKSIQRIGHSMKGTGESFGFNEISRLGKEIEDIAKIRDKNKLIELNTKFLQYINSVEIREETQ